MTMKSSPKPDETPPSTGSKTPASGRKLVQARLPFKTLSGSEPPFTPLNETAAAVGAVVAPITNGTTAVSENRKRKQNTSITQEDGVRAPKINRKDDNDDDIILISTETMEASCDLTVNDIKDDKNDEQFNRSSESKENICLDDDDDAKNESITLDSDDDDAVDDTKKTPKAKQSLSFAEPKSETRKSKRISDANLIKIKLPMTKKAKEAAKKTKKQKKSESNEEKSSESGTDDKMDEPSTSKADESELDDSVFEEDFDKSIMNISIVSNASLCDDPSTPVNQTLTPRQLQRKADSEKKALERHNAKIERERKLQEEKMQRQKEREQKEEQRRREKEERERKIQEEKELKLREKEERKKEREEKERKLLEEKEQKRLEREEKERKVIEEKEQKRKEREEKERKLQEEKEEKIRKKEEEKKKLEEEKEAEQRKIHKTSQAFVKFFVPKKTDGKTVEDANEDSTDTDQTPKTFMSFQVKEGMKVAPIMRRMLNTNERTDLEKIVLSKPTAASELYLSELKTNKIMPRKYGRTLQDDDDEKCSNDDDIFVIGEDAGDVIQVIEEKPKKYYRAKFFKFSENQRPPYYGTWRKKSKLLGPRKPFAQDSTFFNYEIDSDDEWEEEEPGESLHGSDDEKDHESEDDYDIDNEFFVPHGHLSDEELQEDDIDYDNNPEDHKVKMQLIQKQFDKEMKKKTQKLKPRVIGLIWQNADGSQPDNCSNGVWNLLNTNAVLLEGACVKIEPPTSNANESMSDDESTANKSVRRLKITEKEVPDLIRLINGNTYKIDFLTEEFRAFIAKNNPGQREYTTASIKSKIRELAFYQRCPEDGPMHNKKCWYVPIATRKRYNQNDLSFPNEWSYTIPPRRPVQSSDLEPQIDENKPEPIFEIGDDSNSCGLSEALTPETIKQAAMKPNPYNIAKFIRVLSKDEKKKQFDPLRGPMIDLTQEPSTSQTDEKKPTKKRNSSAAAAAIGPKKRVNLLLSGPRGQDFSPKTKTTLVTQFLSQNVKKRQTDAKDENPTKTVAGTSSKKKKLNEPVIVID